MKYWHIIFISIANHNSGRHVKIYFTKILVITSFDSSVYRLIKENRSRDKYFGVYNPDCQTSHQKEIVTSDLALLTSNAIPKSLDSRDIPKLEIQIGPNKLDYIDFVRNGWMSENGKNREVKEVIEARTIEMNPLKGKESWFSIDNEYYEAKPIKITLLPEAVNMFCKKDSSL